MPNPSPEYHIPGSPERVSATEFQTGDQLDLHASKLERLRDDAFGAAAMQNVVGIEGEVAPAPAPIEKLTPSQEVLQFAQKVVQFRYRELDENLLADNPHRPSYLTDQNSRDDFMRAA